MRSIGALASSRRPGAHGRAVPNLLIKRKDCPEKLAKRLINSNSIRRVNHELTFG
jgi:hypothetical protein